MEARNKSVQSWFSLIRDGLLTLPRFQRFEAWKPNQIEGVLENMLREPSLPIGALLILEVRGDELFVSRPISSAPPPPLKILLQSITYLTGNKELPRSGVH